MNVSYMNTHGTIGEEVWMLLVTLGACWLIYGQVVIKINTLLSGMIIVLYENFYIKNIQHQNDPSLRC